MLSKCLGAFGWAYCDYQRTRPQKISRPQKTDTCVCTAPFYSEVRVKKSCRPCFQVSPGGNSTHKTHHYPSSIPFLAFLPDSTQHWHSRVSFPFRTHSISGNTPGKTGPLSSSVQTVACWCGWVSKVDFLQGILQVDLCGDHFSIPFPRSSVVYVVADTFPCITFVCVFLLLLFLVLFEEIAIVLKGGI